MTLGEGLERLAWAIGAYVERVAATRGGYTSEETKRLVTQQLFNEGVAEILRDGKPAAPTTPPTDSDHDILGMFTHKGKY